MKKLWQALALTALLASSAGCTNQEEPPDAFVTIGENEFEMVKGTYEWKTNGLFSDEVVVADAGSPVQITGSEETIPIESEKFATIETEGDTNPEIKAFLWNNEERQLQIPIQNGQMVLPSMSGKHVIEVLATYSNGEVSYSFAVNVKK